MNNEKHDVICDRVRYAISVGDVLDDEMKAHVLECAECRTFLEQSEIMASELKKLGFDTFEKNGKTVADSVMEEVRRQEIFTKGSPVKANKGVFRHIGLIAACAVIMVMALPLLNRVTNVNKGSDEAIVEDANYGRNYKNEAASGGSFNDDAAVSEEAYIEYSEEAADYEDSTGVLCDTQASEKANAGAAFYSDNSDASEDSGNKTMMFMAPPASVEQRSKEETVAEDAVEAETVETETVKNEVADGSETVLYSYKGSMYSAEVENDSQEQRYEAVYDSVVDGICEPAPLASSESVEEAALLGAVIHCGSVSKIVEESLYITYSDDGRSAYAVYELISGESITVYLNLYENVWNATKVCNGDITE